MITVIRKLLCPPYKFSDRHILEKYISLWSVIFSFLVVSFTDPNPSFLPPFSSFPVFSLFPYPLCETKLINLQWFYGVFKLLIWIRDFYFLWWLSLILLFLLWKIDQFYELWLSWLNWDGNVWWTTHSSR